MKYQLVVQLRADSLLDFDALIALEDHLIAELGNSAKVDGHDFGSGQANVFIFTADPDQTFWAVRQVLEREDCLQSASVAYRTLDREEFIVMWPKDSKVHFTIT